MDKLDSIHQTHGEWPQAVGVDETGISPNDLFSSELIDIALELARRNPRQRAIVRIHEKLSDENHLMINAILGESYIPPHKHTEPEKTEIFRIVKGKAFVVFFDDQGIIDKKIEMNADTDGRKIVTVRPEKWHTVVPVGEGTVMLEAKRQPAGGYNPETDKTTAAWAPSQEDVEAGMEYLKNLEASIDKI